MNIDELKNRANNACELCKNSENLSEFKVFPKDESVLLCGFCHENINDPSKSTNHFRCLNESIWSEVDAVKVLSYRLLKKLQNEDFASSLLDMCYLEDELQTWANAKELEVKDANGSILQNGDTISIIKDLEVKGAGFTAKRGTSVKNIVLTDDPAFIECKINGMKIVLKTEFVKKA